MNKRRFKNVLVVLGGESGERKVSLESGKACIQALKKKNYKVSSLDPKNKNLNLINKNKFDVIFNALHGKDGEDGKTGENGKNGEDGRGRGERGRRGWRG